MRLTRTKTEASLEAGDTETAKRRKSGHDVYDMNRNAHLKGRRRFKADLEDLEGLCRAGYSVNGLQLKNIGPGEDDGSFAVVLEKQGKHVLSASFLVSDTSEYPGSHSMFCHSLDPDISSRLEVVVEAIVEQRAQPIKALVDSFFASVNAATAANMKAPMRVRSDTEDEESGEESETYDYDDIEDIGVVPPEPKAVLSLLQKNFLEIVASSYKPGLTRIQGGDDFILSVSVPVVTLAQSIPPRALMAWDRRLLSENQNLVLLISGFRGTYPVLQNDGTYTAAALSLGATLSFKVGLSPRYKPGHEHAREAVRKHGLVGQDVEDELRIQAEKAAQERAYEYWDDEGNAIEETVGEVEADAPDMDRFDRFSLSSSLESLIDQAFLRLVQFRRKFGLGWAGAEVLNQETEKHQQRPEDVLVTMIKQISAADREESLLGRTLALPLDPLVGSSKDEPINLPLTAFSYLIRRLTLCTKYCIVCHNKLNTDYEALKPYVCDSKLCSYQYYSLNRGPSLEYEIVHNPQTVDLLVSLSYVSAMEGAMEDPLPIGMGMRVPHPGNQPPPVPASAALGVASLPYCEPPVEVGDDGLVDFDVLSKAQMRAAISQLIDALPSIEDMKRHLDRKVQSGKSKPKLREIDPSIPPASWLILRWIVCSCTAYIEEITSGDELIQKLDRNWRQFRLTVGAPDAEAKFQTAVGGAVSSDKNAKEYPVLYAFHGSPLRNWHSIVRHGLWYKSVAHGRAYGNGVYLAKDASVSMGGYAVSGRTCWKHSQTNPTNCVALAEIVNLPQKFVSHNPYFVVADTHWIMCRYLLIKGATSEIEGPPPPPPGPILEKKKKDSPFVKIDPAHKTVVGGKMIQIPDPSHQVETILAVRQAEVTEQDFDEEDMIIFSLDPSKESKGKGRQSQNPNDYCAMDIDDEDDYRIPPKPKAAASAASASVQKPKDDWKHNGEYVQDAVSDLVLPPFESSGGASMALQKELRAMQREQNAAKSYRELGWYMPPELIGDNLYQWIVEMHSFDPDLPIAKDMKKNKVNSIIFEIRFPPTFPISPPFFRIITPRFLPFIHGGGGHVTGGGSICMDLLTSNGKFHYSPLAGVVEIVNPSLGWLPSYTIPAVLMQIKLAISNLDPRPARLASNWRLAYRVEEALAGFKRAAATHGWAVPSGFDRLVR